MYKSLTRWQEIRRSQQRLEHILNQLNGTNPAVILWSQPLVIHTKHRSLPAKRQYNNVVSSKGKTIFELNIPFQGINKNISGVFIKDRYGNVFVAHRGRIRGKLRGRGLNRDVFFDYFWNHRRQSVVWTNDGGIRNRVLQIGNINSSTFRRELEEFILAVAEIRRLI